MSFFFSISNSLSFVSDCAIFVLDVFCYWFPSEVYSSFPPAISLTSINNIYNLCGLDGFSSRSLRILSLFFKCSIFNLDYLYGPYVWDPWYYFICYSLPFALGFNFFLILHNSCPFSPQILFHRKSKKKNYFSLAAALSIFPFCSKMRFL